MCCERDGNLTYEAVLGWRSLSSAEKQRSGEELEERKVRWVSDEGTVRGRCGSRFRSAMQVGCVFFGDVP